MWTSHWYKHQTIRHYLITHLTSQCHKPRCAICPKLNNIFTCFTNKRRVTLTDHHLSYDTKGAICLLQCPHCNIQYVREIKASIKIRMRHKFNNKSGTPRILIHPHYDKHKSFNTAARPLTHKSIRREMDRKATTLSAQWYLHIKGTMETARGTLELSWEVWRKARSSAGRD